MSGSIILEYQSAEYLTSYFGKNQNNYFYRSLKSKVICILLISGSNEGEPAIDKVARTYANCITDKCLYLLNISIPLSDGE